MKKKYETPKLEVELFALTAIMEVVSIPVGGINVKPSAKQSFGLDYEEEDEEDDYGAY